MNTLQLSKGREASLLRHHPWVFSGAVARVTGNPAPGSTVQVVAADGKPLGWAAYSPESQIRARMWAFNGIVGDNFQVDATNIASRVQRAVQRRQHLLGEHRTAIRLIYAESDDLPGLIVDRYGDYLSCQFLSVGAEFWRDTIIAALNEHSPNRGIYERSDVTVRKHEGLESRKGLISGEEPPEFITINEAGRLLDVSITEGHKTGYYLDQYDNRSLLQQLCTQAGRPLKVLNCFSYTGGFGIAALKGGAAHVTNVDSSGPALELAGRNLELNGFDPDQAEQVQANLFDYLRDLKQQSGSRYDMIILDPPKFAETRHQFKRASRAYKDIALQAGALLNPGGWLVSFSCSGAIDPPLFQKITADALLDAGRQGRITHHLHQSSDHPVALPFPEALYLKGLICHVD